MPIVAERLGTNLRKVPDLPGPSVMQEAASRTFAGGNSRPQLNRMGANPFELCWNKKNWRFIAWLLVFLGVEHRIFKLGGTGFCFLNPSLGFLAFWFTVVKKKTKNVFKNFGFLG